MKIWKIWGPAAATALWVCATLAGAAPSFAETNISVVPRTLRSAAASPTAPYVRCRTLVSSDAAAVAASDPGCDVDIFGAQMPRGNYQLTFALDLYYPGYHSDASLELYIRRESFPADRFGSFEIALPDAVALDDIARRINERMRLLCGSGAPVTPAYLWQSALWAHASLENTGAGKPIPTAYGAALWQVLYVACRELIADERTGATVALSIVHGGLSMCRANRTTRFDASPGFGPQCAPSTNEPTLKSLADRATERLLGLEIAGLRAAIGENIDAAQRTGRIVHLASVLDVERANSSLRRNDTEALDLEFASLLQQTAEAQRHELASLGPDEALTPEHVAQTAAISETLTAFRRSAALRSADFVAADTSFASLFDESAAIQTRVLEAAPNDAVRDQSLVIGDAFRDFSRRSSIRNTATLRESRDSVTAMEAAARSF